MKKCDICNEIKSLSEFYFRKDSRKHRESCKNCFGVSRKESNKNYKKSKTYKEWKAKYDSNYGNTAAYAAYQAKFKKTDTAKRVFRSAQLRKYWPNLSGPEANARFKKILIDQNGLCAICKQPETAKRSGKVRELCVDHCHKTGTVRGILCAACNTAIGLFRESPKSLKTAALYLEKWLHGENPGDINA